MQQREDARFSFSLAHLCRFLTGSGQGGIVCEAERSSFLGEIRSLAVFCVLDGAKSVCFRMYIGMCSALSLC